MFNSDSFSRLSIKAQEDINEIIPSNFLQHLYTLHFYHNYKHLEYTTYKHKRKHQAQISVKPGKIRTAKTINSSQIVAAKPIKRTKQPGKYKCRTHHITEIAKMEKPCILQKPSVARPQEKNPSNSPVHFMKPADNTLLDILHIHWTTISNTDTVETLSEIPSEYY